MFGSSGSTYGVGGAGSPAAVLPVAGSTTRQYVPLCPVQCGGAAASHSSHGEVIAYFPNRSSQTMQGMSLA